MVKVKIAIGRTQLELEAQDVKTAHKFCSLYASLPEVCDACKSKNVHLFHKSPSGNDYFGIRCKDCGAELTFHQHKDGGGFFVKREDKMEVWKGKGEQNQVVQDVRKQFQQKGGQKGDPFGGVDFDKGGEGTPF